MRRVALIGMPNTGKSSLFNRLTGASARVANWPGMTVDILSARLLLGADMVEVADLPGIHDLSGASEDERVSRQVLETLPVDVALVVVNATQIERQLPLVLSVHALGLPMVVLLNMSDEAERFGVRIDRERLSSALGVPVIAVNARKGSGLGEVKRALVTTLRETRAPDPAMIRERLGQTPPGIETSVAALVAEAVSQPVEFS
ncbi:MAG: FeoB small GTPase domain-containing protein, partial [Halothiobacillaceae bacterium]|nr:FeoB small GTPase domain-containing protein [Halothiobacillaceae bacterium]